MKFLRSLFYRRFHQQREKFTTSYPIWARDVRTSMPILHGPHIKSAQRVLSFGGGGYLVTYSLGVAQYLRDFHPELVRESFLVGAGTGVLPALALASELPSCLSLRDIVLSNITCVKNSEAHAVQIRNEVRRLLPDDIHERIKGRLAIALNPPMIDPGFWEAPKERRLFGSLICDFDSRDDLAEALIAATSNDPIRYRGHLVARGTRRALSTEVDGRGIHHIHVHPYAGNPKRSSIHARHRVLTAGQHLVLVNRRDSWRKQAVLMSGALAGGIEEIPIQTLEGVNHENSVLPVTPETEKVARTIVGSVGRPSNVLAGRRWWWYRVGQNWTKRKLFELFDEGYLDASRFERWEIDSYGKAVGDVAPPKLRTVREVLNAAWSGSPGHHIFDL